MKQIVQNLRNGDTRLVNVPSPALSANNVLIQTKKSLISTGTEKMLVEFGEASLIGKARAQPEKVRLVLDKIRTDGVAPTLEAVFGRLDEPLPLGYCNAGEVIGIGRNVTEFKIGDRVASNGPHAEIVSVPKLLCSKIPDSITDDTAAFTVLASIGLQGIRLVKPTLGETVVVYGAGLIGLITIQLLISNGCRAVAVDINQSRLDLAASYGADCILVNPNSDSDIPAKVNTLTHFRGADAVIITASTQEDSIIRESALMLRKKGRIVLVGQVGLNFDRSHFYEKEISFQVSCSYGPGRYDEEYEDRGNDYPIGYVRWTEQRNFEAILDLLSKKRIEFDSLISNRFSISQTAEAYRTVTNSKQALGVLLEYPVEVDDSRTILVNHESAIQKEETATVALVGSGNFGKLVLSPALKKTSCNMKYVVARTNSTAVHHLSEKYGFKRATTDLDEVLLDTEVNAVFIATRSDSHSDLAVKMLRAGKHVFIEKPLGTNVSQIKNVLEQTKSTPSLHFMVGFNRRFSPHSMKCKNLLAGRSEPLAMHFLANAGIIPPGSWVHDHDANGGRVVGEACHYIDLMVYLTGSLVKTVSAQQMPANKVAVGDDKMTINLGFRDGSIGSVNYFSNGAASYPKESMEIFSEGRIIKIDNFRKTSGYGFKGFKKYKTLKLDKGHQHQFSSFINKISTGGTPLIPMDQLINVTLATFAARSSAIENRTIDLDSEYAELINN